MDSEVLSRQITSLFRQFVEEAFPDVVKGVVVNEIPQEDGTMRSEIEEQRGPLEFDEEQFAPLARAIATAVVEHLQSNAEVEDIVSGENWRIL